MFIDYRLFYTKTGRLKYISHLDTNRLMQRTLKRSGLPVWYSEGFNPHIYITFALPLALGLESEYEVMDFRLTAERPANEIAEKTQDSFPEGMKVLSIAKPVLKPHDISSALFEVKLISSQPRRLLEEWNAFLDRSEILTEKKSKKGMKTVDIRPDISVTASEMTENAFCLSLVLPAGPEKNISPLLVLDAFSKISSVQPEHTSVLKKAVYDKSGKLFR